MKEKKSTPIIIGAIGIAVIIIVLVAVMVVSNMQPSYVVNRKDHETGLTVGGDFKLYSGEKLGYSFQYPNYLDTSYDAKDGVYIYGEEGGSNNYVLICKIGKKTSPKSYFADTNKLMLKTFASVQSTPIQEVNLDEKTLYMTRYIVESNGSELTIDRYVELYSDSYIQYTVVSETAGSLDTIVYYAAKTMKTAEGAYAGAFSNKKIQYMNGDTDIKVSLPAMLDPKELTIGYIARNDDAIVLCVLCKQDDWGNPIYNRQNFIDMASENSGFVAGYLGVEAADFEDGKAAKIGGNDFYVYPMQLVSKCEDFEGELYLTDAPASGVYLVCYAVREGAPNAEALKKLCKECAESFSVIK